MTRTPVEIAPEPPTAPDVVELLRAHHAFARAETPPKNAHVLDGAGLAASGAILFVARVGGALAGFAALKELDTTHGEVK